LAFSIQYGIFYFQQADQYQLSVFLTFEAIKNVTKVGERKKHKHKETNEVKAPNCYDFH